MIIRLSDAAQADLAAIRDYTLENFGQRQSDVYRGRLEQGMVTLLALPEIGLRHSDLPEGCRAFRVAHHWICYRIALDAVEIIRLVRRFDEFDGDNKE